MAGEGYGICPLERGDLGFNPSCGETEVQKVGEEPSKGTQFSMVVCNLKPALGLSAQTFPCSTQRSPGFGSCSSYPELEPASPLGKGRCEGGSGFSCLSDFLEMVVEAPRLQRGP
jgi:hypothetical protein